MTSLGQMLYYYTRWIKKVAHCEETEDFYVAEPWRCTLEVQIVRDQPFNCQGQETQMKSSIFTKNEPGVALLTSLLQSP